MNRERKVCLRNRDIELIIFLGEYGVISNENVKLLYGSEFYYKNRLASLAKGDIIERIYGKVVLGRKGKSYLNKIGVGYRNTNRSDNYKKRMEYVSEIAFKVQNSGWYFEPSWRCDVNTFTKRGNRFIGIMSREKREYGESDESFYKRAYLVYFLHSDITPRELKYIDKEISRNTNKFEGMFVFVNDEQFIQYPKFVNVSIKEFYTILCEDKAWTIFSKIRDEEHMKNWILGKFGYYYKSLSTYIYEIYYSKHEGIYTYVFPMPFIDFARIRSINYMANDDDYDRVKFKVVCQNYYLNRIRENLDERVDVIGVE